MSLSVDTVNSINGTTKTSAVMSADDAAGSQDRFLKLLTTQLQNQDPLSPMDNAELTSQIAQINTVTGITTLNSSVQQLSSQFVQMQALQGAALVGKDVIVPGNKLDVTEGVAQGGFQLDTAASAVKVEVMNPAGVVVDTLNLGAQSGGMQSFNWKAGNYTNADELTFKVTATSGASTISSTPLMRDTVTAINTSSDSLMLELERTGNVAYSTVKALN
jgi:flagellar basal-body rod modification protein FlgD